MVPQGRGLPGPPGGDGKGPQPSAQDASQVPGLSGHLVGNFPFLTTFAMQKGTGTVERVSTADFCSLIACLILALEYS